MRWAIATGRPNCSPRRQLVPSDHLSSVWRLWVKLGEQDRAIEVITEAEAIARLTPLNAPSACARRRLCRPSPCTLSALITP
ncbi:hypothetical protein [Streptomyces sp. NPDC020681]|uniref:hypothetical protein n=1 Tax=Streptomyces sp. NPDC020681 TaxID=3365083 RepID=UPI0037AFEAF4